MLLFVRSGLQVAWRHQDDWLLGIERHSSGSMRVNGHDMRLFVRQKNGAPLVNDGMTLLPRRSRHHVGVQLSYVQASFSRKLSSLHNISLAIMLRVQVL